MKNKSECRMWQYSNKGAEDTAFIYIYIVVYLYAIDYNTRVFLE